MEVRNRQVQDTKKVSESVKREEAHIEGEGDVNVEPQNKRTA